MVQITFHKFLDHHFISQNMAVHIHKSRSMTEPNHLACVPSKDSDQPGHPPSLIRVFAVRFMGSLGPNASSCRQWILWSYWADGCPGWSELSCCGSYLFLTAVRPPESQQSFPWSLQWPQKCPRSNEKDFWAEEEPFWSNICQIHTFQRCKTCPRYAVIVLNRHTPCRMF